MGGGLMQLVAMGAQDVFLTGNPQITFFKVVYRRHTNFSKECIPQQVVGKVNATGSSTVNCVLARNGDLVQEIYVNALLKARDAHAVDGQFKTVLTAVNDAVNGFKLSAADNNLSGVKANTAEWLVMFRDQDGTGKLGADNTIVFNKEYRIYSITGVDMKIAEVNAPHTPLTVTVQDAGGEDKVDVIFISGYDANNLVKEVEVEIGGQTIDKHYATWLDIYNELFESNIDGLNELTSHNHPSLTAVGNADETNSSRVVGGDASGAKRVNIPLRFWFNRNPGLALPLIALQYHEVKIILELNSVAHSVTELGNTDVQLLVNYIYLDTDERRRFAQVSHEYLIEQVQYTTESSARANLSFNHPVKALFWKPSYNTDHTVNEFAHATLSARKVTLQLNGHDRFKAQEPDYFHLVQPYESGLGHTKQFNSLTRTWGDVSGIDNGSTTQMYSFCLKPGEHQPSGSCNFSRIDNARLELPGNKSCEIFALNYNVLRIMSGMGGLTYSN